MNKITIYAIRQVDTGQILEMGRTPVGSPHHEQMTAHVTEADGELDMVTFEIPWNSCMARFPENLFFIDGKLTLGD